MTFFSKNLRIAFSLFILLIFLFPYKSFSQDFITCNIDGEEYKGKIEEATQVKIGEENFIQVKSTEGDHILYLYIKLSKINNNLPLTLNNKDHDVEKGEIPYAEIVWVPDGPDSPQWNTVDGTLTVTSFNTDERTISGTFEFKAEKHVYGSRAKKERPSVELKNGKFENLHYKLSAK